ncbi:MAG TPA: hypothetical protein VG479_02185 [Gaiellaceae bacterium]|jgi:hypothetical protein|nr:hypothetical protein [Gaiellaceae bacterium]
MYDQLTGRYTFPCPRGGEIGVRLSRFRTVERLPGAAHPAVYRVTFACDCGEEHDGLVTHDELDWAPLAGSDAAFLNLMTARLESAAEELLDLAAGRIRAGDWPWSFFCYPEERSRPVYPSAFRLLGGGEEEVGLAVECPSCSHTSVNVVSREHVDVPFFNDRRVGVVEHVFPRDRALALAAFREELDSGLFDARRRDLAA